MSCPVELQTVSTDQLYEAPVVEGDEGRDIGGASEGGYSDQGEPVYSTVIAYNIVNLNVLCTMMQRNYISDNEYYLRWGESIVEEIAVEGELCMYFITNQ